MFLPNAKGKNLTNIRLKQKVTAQTIDNLDGCYGGLAPRGAEIYGLTERIGHCIDNANIYLAEGLHNKDTGELFDGSGSLWGCGSRLCAFCVGKPSKKHRKEIRYAMDNAKLFVGENWYFPTFTMPDIALKDLSLPDIARVKQTAWENFTHYETNPKKSQTWYQKHFRGGFKNCEFTFTDNDLYHYHLHALMIGKSKIQRDKFYEIRREWTKSLKFAFAKHGIAWECNTGNKNFIPALYSFLWSKPLMSLFLNAKDETKFFGLAVVNVVKVDYTNREKTILELCKYVTKNDSWVKVPDHQLLEIASMARFWRMFEKFGVCREIVRQMSKLTPKEQNRKNELQKEAEDSYFLLLEFLLYTNGHGYLDTTFSIPSVLAQLCSYYANAPPKKKKRSWFNRLKDGEISLPDYCRELEIEVAAVINFRKIQLRRMYPYAIFKTANNWAF